MEWGAARVLRGSGRVRTPSESDKLSSGVAWMYLVRLE